MDDTQQEQQNAAEALLAVEQMIQRYLADIATIREKLKTQKEMFTQSFEQDKEYTEAAEAQKETKRKQAAAKERIVKTDAAQAVKMTMGNLQEEMKEAQQALSDYLNRYVQLTDKSDFTGPEGEIFQIVRTARLVKKR